MTKEKNIFENDLPTIKVTKELHKQIKKIGTKMRLVFNEMKEANITDFDYFRAALTEDWEKIDHLLKQRDEIENKAKERTNNYIFLAWLSTIWSEE